MKLLSCETLKLKKNDTFEPDKKSNTKNAMKRTIIIIALVMSIVSCNKSTQETKVMKTAYVDTSKLLEEYTEAKDIEAKYKAKSEVMGKELETEVTNFKAAAADFQKRAPSMGQVWAQENGAKLQRREQELSYAQDAMLQQLRQESGVEMDTLVKQVKRYIKDYGKEKGYDYIYGTGEAVSILYGQEKYDITKDIVKLLNEKYKAPQKEDESAVKADAKKELEAIENKK